MLGRLDSEFAMILRPATMEDAERLFAWRNDPETVAACASGRSVEWTEHVAWLGRNLSAVFVAETDRPVGTVRIADGELSWTIALEMRGKGLGAEMVRLALDLAPRPATARIRRENIASRKIAERNGFALAQDGPLQMWIFRGLMPAPS